MNDPIEITYESGTLTLSDNPEYFLEELGGKWDKRTKQWRAPANKYRDIIFHLANNSIEYSDRARNYEKLELSWKKELIPRKHQSEALAAWCENKMLGCVCLPTGAGKTILAILTMFSANRSTLIVVPTIDLLHQWEAVIKTYFDCEVGILGGGQYEVKPITVSTYDSAQMHIEHLGNKFGLLICDEAHHLPGPQYKKIAMASLAPLRLGLSATFKRSDGAEEFIYELLGKIVYEGRVQGLIGKGLSPYDVVTVELPLSEQDQNDYKFYRKIYTDFLFQNRINMRNKTGWTEFIKTSSWAPGGKEAMEAYRKQKKISQGSYAKVRYIFEILKKHLFDKIIIFTADNEMAYMIGRTYFLPVLTHQTKLIERKKMLESFKNGHITTLVTSKVLNEGVDVPDASIAIVISGTATVREHVQRLGRILRQKDGKKATLYELLAKNTSEHFTSKRRRDHHAYKGPAQV